VWRDDVKNWIIEYIGVKKRPELYQGVLAGISVVPHQFPSGKKGGLLPTWEKKERTKIPVHGALTSLSLSLFYHIPVKCQEKNFIFTAGRCRPTKAPGQEPSCGEHQ
jgi:hypothetical protein